MLDYDTWKTTDPDEVDERGLECLTCSYRADECSCMPEDQNWVKTAPEYDPD